MNKRLHRGSRRAHAAVGRGIVVALATGVIGLAFAPLACAPERLEVGAGGECFVATDCEPGLICVPQRDGSRECSSDLSQVAGRPPPTPQQDGAAQDGAAEGAPPQEAGDQDTGVDTGAPDTGSD